LCLLARFLTTAFLTGAVILTLFASKAADVGELKATIREWEVPTKGAKPYAMTVSLDGSIGFADELASKIGHLNPKIGELKEYPLTNGGNIAPTVLLQITAAISGSQPVLATSSRNSNRP